ncbi:MAG: deoxyguanosinetriphosphate triphosphohydrolase [Coriobacteriales bacterium]|nr:deoxyguanosinetriphosphate triphosphohydrolase [Coriobacteriales bacterium]
MQRYNSADREAQEERFLSPDASLSSHSKGRAIPLDADPYRSSFQRDRDRILHSKAFRRLSHKTQVFLAPEGDHYRTRLTHTLEVSQISRTIARALGLNEDLTEAISLGHDLGHTPFGHTGEDALSYCIAKRLGREVERGPACVIGYGKERFFRHNEQSLRVVDFLEREGKGLDLCWEVRDGIVHHTGKEKAATLEGRIVATADRIAYVNHDLDDAVRAGLLRESDVPDEVRLILGEGHSSRIGTLVQDMIETSSSAGDIMLSANVAAAMDQLRSFLFERVYTSEAAKLESSKAFELLLRLFEHYCEHPQEIPETTLEIARKHPLPQCPDDVLCAAVVDHIAGMTDRFARSTFEALFVPRSWHGTAVD